MVSERKDVNQENVSMLSTQNFTAKKMKIFIGKKMMFSIFSIVGTRQNRLGDAVLTGAHSKSKKK